MEVMDFVRNGASLGNTIKRLCIKKRERIKSYKKLVNISWTKNGINIK